jgi:hypothetical protein
VQEEALRAFVATVPRWTRQVGTFVAQRRLAQAMVQKTLQVTFPFSVGAVQDGECLGMAM